MNLLSIVHKYKFELNTKQNVAKQVSRYGNSHRTHPSRQLPLEPPSTLQLNIFRIYPPYNVPSSLSYHSPTLTLIYVPTQDLVDPLWFLLLRHPRPTTLTLMYTPAHSSPTLCTVHPTYHAKHRLWSSLRPPQPFEK